MQQFKTTRLITRMMFVTNMVLVLLLGRFLAIPLLTGSDPQYLNQAALQRTRSYSILTAVLTLEFRPSLEKAQALNDLQVALPFFQQEQAILLANPSATIQLLLTQARPDY